MHSGTPKDQRGFDLRPFQAFRALLAALTAALWFSVIFDVSAAAAEEWQKLPDGRTVIDVKGVRLGLPTTGPDLGFIEFRDIPGRRTLTLKDTIARPDDARELFAKAAVVNVGITIPPTQVGLFLGKFPRTQFPSFTSGLVIGLNVDGNCSYWEEHYAQLRSQLSPGDPRIGPYGWAEFKEGDHPPLWSYVQPSSGPDPPFKGINCDYSVFCGSAKCFGRNIGFSYQFNRKMFGQPDWQALNERIYDALRFVLLDFGK
jgi:hypothetical protein